MQPLVKPAAESKSSPPAQPRVLLVLEATLGGTLRYIQNLQEALAEAPLTIGFAYATERADQHLPATLDRARSLGWQLFPIAMRRPVDPGSDLAAGLALARVMRQFRPAIVHCHSSKAGALGRVAALALGRARLRRGAAGTRVLYSPHAIAPSAAYRGIERMLAPLSDHLVAVSHSEAAQLAELKVSRRGGCSVVYPVIDGDAFAPRSRAAARAALGLPQDRSQSGPLLVGVGRMAAQKRPLDFVEVLAAVRRSIPNAHGLWVGGGELEPAFAERVRVLGLEGVVRSTGWVDDVRPYLAAADLAISTSQYESFGYNLAEALAMGIPSIGSRVCGTTDVLAEAPGDVLFAPGDADGAARQAIAILGSPELARRHAEQGRETVLRRFSTSAMRAGLMQAYGEALGLPGFAASLSQAPHFKGAEWRTPEAGA